MVYANKKLGSQQVIDDLQRVATDVKENGPSKLPEFAYYGRKVLKYGVYHHPQLHLSGNYGSGKGTTAEYIDIFDPENPKTLRQSIKNNVFYRTILSTADERFREFGGFPRFTHLEMSALLKSNEKALEYMKKRELVPDEIVIPLQLAALDNAIAAYNLGPNIEGGIFGFITDGFYRGVSQIQALKEKNHRLCVVDNRIDPLLAGIRQAERAMSQIRSPKEKGKKALTPARTKYRFDIANTPTAILNYMQSEPGIMHAFEEDFASRDKSTIFTLDAKYTPTAKNILLGVKMLEVRGVDVSRLTRDEGEFESALEIMSTEENRLFEVQGDAKKKQCDYENYIFVQERIELLQSAVEKLSTARNREIIPGNITSATHPTEWKKLRRILTESFKDLKALEIKQGNITA
ncbi:MAG: hypothetical protein ACI8Y7_000568 [Candidatus Woesearchaeota archaeon]|jgi:hypothetical protein